jgi:carbon starvation protein
LRYVLALAYRWYGRWLTARVFPLDDSEPTPAHTLRDGRDFVPAPPLVVFGHHFASIAGLGPLLGPAIAVILGLGSCAAVDCAGVHLRWGSA